MFLDSSISVDENRLSISGLSIMRVDLVGNTKRGVCLHYKEHLSIISRHNVSHLKELWVKEISVKK